jgi:hypothetical protein
MPMLADAVAVPSDGVLLHIGVHKTGTTAIQAALADARPELASAGVSYPGKLQAQHRAALAVLQRPWGWNARGGAVMDRSHFDKLARRVAGTRGRVVISSEFFCEAPADVAAQVVQDLGSDRVHVVVTLRNLGRLLPSSWQQYLKYGLTTPYEKWLTDVFAEPGATKNMTPTFWKRHDHGDVITRWSDAVGPDNVTVLILEDVDRSAMFRSFAQLLDVAPDVLVSRMDLTSNRSMTAAEAELLVRLNKKVKKELQWDEYVRFVRRGVALGMVEGREPAADEPRLHTPDWALDAAVERGQRSAHAIRASGVRVLGDLEALTRRVDSPPPVSAAEAAVLPVDAAVQAVMTVIEAARDNPTSRELAGQLWRRTRQEGRDRLRRGTPPAS